MKERITLCLFIFFTMFSSRAQHTKEIIKVNYNLKYLADTAETAFLEEPAKLIIDAELSYFSTNKELLDDSISFFNMDESNYVAKKTLGLRTVKNFSENLVYAYEQFIPKDFLCSEESMAEQQWKILGDTDSLYNYACQKAVLKYGGKEWTAWFTPDIPISDGPYKFCGLPGLILRMQDTKGRWFIDFTGLEKEVNKGLDLSYLAKAKKMGRVELYKEKKSFKSNPMQKLEAAGVLGFQPQDRAEIYRVSIEKTKKDNNWIERYE